MVMTAVAASVWHRSKWPSTTEAVGPGVVCVLVLVIIVRPSAEERMGVALVLEICDEVPEGRGLVVVSY